MHNPTNKVETFVSTKMFYEASYLLTHSCASCRLLTLGGHSGDLNSCFATVCHEQPVSHLPLVKMGSLMPLNIV